MFGRQSAEHVAGLSQRGFTHVLNAADGGSGGRPRVYEGLRILYKGIQARDSCQFDLSVSFQAAADFIHQALSSGGERAR